MSGADRPGQLPAEASWPSRALLDGIRSRLPGQDAADVALVLGSGLGAIAGELEEPIVFEASELEGYPESTVAGHHGRRAHLTGYGGQKLIPGLARGRFQRQSFTPGQLGNISFPATEIQLPFLSQCLHERRICRRLWSQLVVQMGDNELLGRDDSSSGKRM